MLSSRIAKDNEYFYKHLLFPTWPECSISAKVRIWSSFSANIFLPKGTFFFWYSPDCQPPPKGYICIMWGFLAAQPPLLTLLPTEEREVQSQPAPRSTLPWLGIDCLSCIHRGTTSLFWKFGRFGDTCLLAVFVSNWQRGNRDWREQKLKGGSESHRQKWAYAFSFPNFPNFVRQIQTIITYLKWVAS